MICIAREPVPVKRIEKQDMNWPLVGVVVFGVVALFGLVKLLSIDHT